MDKTRKEKREKEGCITAASHMFTLRLARMKIKVRMIFGLKEINFFDMGNGC